MAFRFSPCPGCCGCLKDPPDQVALSLSSMHSRATIQGSYTDPPQTNPTDISPFNGTWYLDGPEDNWRNNNWRFDFSASPDYYSIFYPTAIPDQLCAYTADIDPIPVELIDPWWGTTDDPPEIICTVNVVKLAFVVGKFTSDPQRYYNLAVVYLDADEKVIVAGSTSTLLQLGYDGYDFTNLSTDWSSNTRWWRYPYYETLATMQRAADCAATTKPAGLSSFHGSMADSVFDSTPGATLSLWVP